MQYPERVQFLIKKNRTIITEPDTQRSCLAQWQSTHKLFSDI